MRQHLPGAFLLLFTTVACHGERSLIARGVVRDAEGRPIRAAHVQFQFRGHPMALDGETDEGGRFLLYRTVKGPSRDYAFKADVTGHKPVVAEVSTIKEGEPPGRDAAAAEVCRREYGAIGLRGSLGDFYGQIEVSPASRATVPASFHVPGAPLHSEARTRT
jgi:hypothetical protein